MNDIDMRTLCLYRDGKGDTHDDCQLTVYSVCYRSLHIYFYDNVQDNRYIQLHYRGHSIDKSKLRHKQRPHKFTANRGKQAKWSWVWAPGQSVCETSDMYPCDQIQGVVK